MRATVYGRQLTSSWVAIQPPAWERGNTWSVNCSAKDGLRNRSYYQGAVYAGKYFVI